jgi:hypothetical protein
MMKYISMIAAMKDNTYSSKRSLKVSLVVHPDSLSYDERRKWNLQGMESIRNSMDPRVKEKHEEEHEDSKKEREFRTTSHCIKNHKITSLI